MLNRKFNKIENKLLCIESFVANISNYGFRDKNDSVCGQWWRVIVFSIK